MKLKINQIEIFAYFLGVLMVFLTLIANVLIFKRASTRPPTRANLPDVPQPTGTQLPEPSTPGSLTGILNILEFILILGLTVFIIIFLYKAANWYKGSSLRPRTNRKKEIEENIQKIRDARTRAYEIIDEGLRNKTYTKSFIEAYHALDQSLDFFREIRRPKYWTPKEYAYSVSAPVFQPSVFRFVTIFYNLRYGMQDATQNDLIEFRENLDYLFIDDIPLELKQRWSEEFEKTRSQRIKYQIPRWIDPTRPKGGIK